MGSKYSPYKVEDGKEIQIIRDSDGEIHSGNWCIDKMKTDDDMICFGTFEDEIRGPRQLARLTMDATYDTTLITGKSGHGKEEMIRNIKLQLLSQGRGLVNIVNDQESAQKFINRLPEDRMDDTILINYPQEKGESIGFNILESPVDENHELYEKSVENISQNLVDYLKNESDIWEPQIGNTTENLIEQLVRAEDPFSLADLIKIIRDEQEREAFMENYWHDQEGYAERIDVQDLTPVRRIIRSLVQNRNIRSSIANNPSNFDMRDAILNDKTVIFDLDGLEDSMSKRIVPEMITMRIKTVLSSLKNSKTHIILEDPDELGQFSRDLISETKDAEYGLFLSINRMNKYDNELKRDLRSFKNKQAFTTSQDDSEASVVAQMFDIASKDVMNLHKHSCISYVMTKDGYRSEIPVEVTVFRDRPPVGERDLDTVSELSKNEYGGNCDTGFKNPGCLKYL